MEYTCIICPQSCDIKLVENADGSLDISGNKCKRGLSYAENEFRTPTRMLTTTVAVEGGRHRRLPVISSQTVPKEKLHDCLRLLYALQVQPPVAVGEVVVKDILSTGADILAARSIENDG